MLVCIRLRRDEIIYDENGVYLHEWLFGETEANLTFIRKEDRVSVNDKGHTVTSTKDMEVVDIPSVCKSIDIPCNLTNANKIAYHLDRLEYKEK